MRKYRYHDIKRRMQQAEREQNALSPAVYEFRQKIRALKPGYCGRETRKQIHMYYAAINEVVVETGIVAHDNAGFADAVCLAGTDQLPANASKADMTALLKWLVGDAWDAENQDAWEYRPEATDDLRPLMADRRFRALVEKIHRAYTQTYNHQIGHDAARLQEVREFGGRPENPVQERIMVGRLMGREMGAELIHTLEGR